MDVDRRRGDTFEEARREDLHVAREHDEIDLCEQREHLCLGGRLVAGRHVVERQVEVAGALLEIGVIRDDEGGTSFELTLLEPPEEVEQAVVDLRDEDRDALRRVAAREAPVHAEALGEPGEVRADVVGELRLDAQEEAVAGRVLLGIDDVRSSLVEEARHGGHDPGAVGARDEQAQGRVEAHRATPVVTHARAVSSNGSSPTPRRLRNASCSRVRSSSESDRQNAPDGARPDGNGAQQSSKPS